MEKYKLLCKKENEEILIELLKANHILLDSKAAVTLCEQGISPKEEGDVIIYFRIDKIASLLNVLRASQTQPLSILMGKKEDTYVPIEITNVVFFHAYGNDTYANTLDGNQYRIKHKLYELEDDILSKRFIRINKSEIVNIQYICKITPMFKGKFILKMQGYKEPLDISRNFIKEFKERIGM